MTSQIYGVPHLIGPRGSTRKMPRIRDADDDDNDDDKDDDNDDKW